MTAKLYLVHCGFYDSEVCGGLYESHANFFVAAEHFEGAKAKAKALPEYQLKRMHIDGLQEIVAIDGWRVSLREDPALLGKTLLLNQRQRELAAKPSGLAETSRPEEKNI